MKTKKLYYYFKMLRIKDWIKSYFWISLFGAFLANASWKNFLLIAIIYFCVTGYSFIVNNYFDVEIDRKHQGKIKSNKNPLAQGFITRKETLILLGILLSISIILAIQLNFIGFIFVLLSLSASTLYSIKFIRLKERLILDLTTHGFMFGFFPFLAGVTLAQGNLNLLSILAGTLFAIITANELLIHQIVDYKDDLENTKTTAIKIGLKISYIYLILLLAACVLCFGMIKEYCIIDAWNYYSFLLLLFWLPFHYAKEIKEIDINQKFNKFIKI